MKRRLSKADKKMRAYQRAQERQCQAMWRAEGRSLADYKAGIDNMASEVWEWRRAKGRASIAAEREAWLRDHPGNPLPEHMCSLTDVEHAEYLQWRAAKRPPAIAAAVGTARARRGVVPKPRVVEAAGHANKGDKPGRRRTGVVGGFGETVLTGEEGKADLRLGQRTREHQQHGRAEANTRKRAAAASIADRASLARSAIL